MTIHSEQTAEQTGNNPKKIRKFRPILYLITCTLMNTSHSITQPTGLDSFCVNPLAPARRAKPVSFHFTTFLLSFPHNGASAPQTQPEGLDNRRLGERSEQYAQPQPRTTSESSHPRSPTGVQWLFCHHLVWPSGQLRPKILSRRPK